MPRRSAPSRVLIIGCGALAPELVALTRHLPNVDVSCLPATLHNRPGGIPAALRERIRARRGRYDAFFVAYADCGTGGLLDRVLQEEGVERLPGAHCYEVFAGRAAFERLTGEEPATFFLTDFLVRNFDRLVWHGLGLDRHPELLPIYFGNYRRVVYLAQTGNGAARQAAERAAARLGLDFEYRFTGLDHLAVSLAPISSRSNGRGTKGRFGPLSGIADVLGSQNRLSGIRTGAPRGEAGDPVPPGLLSDGNHVRAAGAVTV